MYELNVEVRDALVKAKQLQKKGMVPANVDMGKGKENLYVTIPTSIAKKLLREKSKGSRVAMKTKAETYPVLLKEVQYDGLNDQIQNLTFQLLVDDQYIKSVAKIVVKNKDKVPTAVQMLQPEIPYKALAKHIVETVEVDAGKLQRGDKVLVKDLDISKDENVEILIEPDRMVLGIAN